SRLAFNESSRNADRWRCNCKVTAQWVARRGFQCFPFLPRRDRQELRAHAFHSNTRENAALQVQRGLSLLIERMHGHDTDLATLADEDTRHRMVDGARRMNSRRKPPYWPDWIPGVSIKNRGRIKPAAARGIEEPSSVVIGRPPPRLKTDPGPAKRGIHDPLPVGEGRPAKARAERPPAISVCTTVGKGAIGIEISEPGRVVRRTCVLQSRACGAGNAIDATGNPAIKVIFTWKAADGQRRIVACLDGEGLAVVEPRLILIVQNGNAALIGLDRTAVVEIIHPECAAVIRFHG